jgi:hypothetical protein
LIEDAVAAPKYKGRNLTGVAATPTPDYSKTLLCSTLVSLNFYKGFSIYTTKSTADTAFTLLTMATKIEKENQNNKIEYRGGGGNNETATESEPPQNTLITKKRNDNITVANIAELMLCQIPQVNEKTARAILAAHNNNIYTLITHLKENPQCLDEVKTGKMRIKKTTIQNIITYLCI